jgi:hypothetical protein
MVEKANKSPEASFIRALTIFARLPKAPSLNTVTLEAQISAYGDTNIQTIAIKKTDSTTF